MSNSAPAATSTPTNWHQTVGQRSNSVTTAVVYLWTTGDARELIISDARCRAYAKRFSWDVITTMTDTGGSNLDLTRDKGIDRFGRPGLTDALTLIRTHEATVLITASDAMLGGTSQVRDAVHEFAEKHDAFVQIVEASDV